MGTPHNRAEKGDIAKSILLPGDPLRAKYIAENYLENAVLFNDVRGMLGFTGSYKGKRVSVMGTGMGVPSISIYVSELMMFYDVENLIRIGTCGSLREDIRLKDLVLAMGCCTDNGVNRHIFAGDYAPLADFELLSAAYDNIAASGDKPYVGLVKTSDMFYGEQVPGAEYWTQYGVIAVEMESAALYTLAAKFKRRALTICSVSDGIFEKTELSSEERETALDRMIKAALETAAQFA
ncbi:MAG: purine-nucleoside phosphorylase [Oscillospiraceae bacterium]|nr:purine-nucleoside phosphorylase [Oscillospiraceae bacterium]